MKEAIISGRVAVVSDIHSNLEAFEKTLDHIDEQSMQRAGPIEKTVCVGDVVGYGDKPRECIDLAVERCDKIGRGNHEQSVDDAHNAPLLALTSVGDCGEGANEGTYWAHRQVYGVDTKLEDTVEEMRATTQRIVNSATPEAIARLKSEFHQKLHDNIPESTGLFEKKRDYAKRVADYARFSAVVQADSDHMQSEIARIEKGNKYIELMRSWPTQYTLQIGKYKVLFVHDNPIKPGNGFYALLPNNPLFNDTERKYSADQIFDLWGTVCPDIDIVVTAHSHFSFVKNDPKASRRKQYNRILVNAGSIGIPRDGEPEATCLIINPNAPKRPVTIQRVKGIDYEAIGQRWASKGLANKFLELSKLD